MNKVLCNWKIEKLIWSNITDVLGALEKLLLQLQGTLFIFIWIFTARIRVVEAIGMQIKFFTTGGPWGCRPVQKEESEFERKKCDKIKI